MENFITKLKKIGKSKKTPTLPSKIYLKAMILHDLKDLEVIKSEVKSGNILIIRITSVARNGVKSLNQIINELSEFTREIGGDIARLGDERVVITPSLIRIWRRRAISGT
jgi:hypothetical protein